MPRGLRQEADAMSFEAFHDEYASSSGPLRLGNWQCTDAERPSTRLGPQARNYQATLAVGDRIGIVGRRVRTRRGPDRDAV